MSLCVWADLSEAADSRKIWGSCHDCEVLDADEWLSYTLFNIGPAFTLLPVAINPGPLTRLARLLKAVLFLATDFVLLVSY